MEQKAESVNYDYENEILKQLLKSAMKDINHMAAEIVELKKKLGVRANPEKLETGWYDVCTTMCISSPCLCYSPCDGICEKAETCHFEWRYADEVKECVEDEW